MIAGRIGDGGLSGEKDQMFFGGLNIVCDWTSSLLKLYNKASLSINGLNGIQYTEYDAHRRIFTWNRYNVSLKQDFLLPHFVSCINHQSQL